MTLARQLLAGITLAFLVLLAGIETIYVTLARNALQEQLSGHANETATSLALSIGSRMSALDPALVNTIVNPVFDRGHFEVIEVREAGGAQVLERRLGSAELEVPRWFAALVAFEPPVGQALVSSGWKQLGRVSVQVHPKFAYKQLWDTATATLVWLSVLFALALVAMRFYLAGILRPLRSIEEAALAIGERRFVSIDVVPRARELREVTGAINSLSAKIRAAMSEEAARVQRLRREAFEDPTTGKLNRRGLENTLGAALEKRADVHSGALALFSVGGLEEVNRAAGIDSGNAVLSTLAAALETPCGSHQPIVGRWQGTVFAAFIANVPRDEAERWAASACAAFVEGLKAANLPSGVAASAGIAHFPGGDATAAQLGHLAQRALADVLARGGGVLAYGVEGGAPAEVDIRGEIEAALAGGRLSLLYQKVASIPDGNVLQVEFMSQLIDATGRAIPAAIYIPAASQFGLLPAVDHRVLELAIKAIGSARDLPHAVSLNVAGQSLLDPASCERLLALLRAHPREARRLVFETTGASASRLAEPTKAFARELRRAGSRLALDNFELDRAAIGLVNELMPAYVKLAPAYTREIGEREDTRFILESMLRVFRPLEIPVIAQGVENEAMVATLRELGLSGYQGYVLGRPRPLD